MSAADTGECPRPEAGFASAVSHSVSSAARVAPSFPMLKYTVSSNTDEKRASCKSDEAMEVA